MNKNTYCTRMLGLVTLYNPNPQEAVANIQRYIHDVDALIIWDNSPLEAHLKEQFFESLREEAEKVVWHGDGQNHCIAPAINYALHHAVENHYDLILLMDEDSNWDNFQSYRLHVEKLVSDGSLNIFTPYVNGCDDFQIIQEEQVKHFFINSGAVIPTKLLLEIGGVNEEAFPLDAIDHDMAYSVRKKGYKVVCLTNHKLNHSLGSPQRLGFLRIYTPNYNSFRTYSMTRSHIICYRKHYDSTTKIDKSYLYREILFRKFYRILLAEPDKWNRMKAFLRGIKDGCTYKIAKNG